MPTDKYSVVATVSGTENTNGETGLYGMSVFPYDRTTQGFTYKTVNNAGQGAPYGCSFAVNCTDATLPTTFTESEIQSVIDANPKGIAKAWVNFDGSAVTAAEDMTGVKSSMNVDAVVDIDQANYKVIFDNAVGANPVICGTCGLSGTADGSPTSIRPYEASPSSVSFTTNFSSSEGIGGFDFTYIAVAVFSS